MKRASSVTEYLDIHPEWGEELTHLRSLANRAFLEETIKWGAPTYTVKGKNVMGIGAFKSYVGLWFFNGHFLKDEAKVLVNAQDGKTKAMRQWRFQSVADMNDDLILAYMHEAIDNQKAGKEIKPQRNTKALLIPDVLQKALDADGALKNMYETFSLSKKREYADHIGGAKREATQQSRLEKAIPMIKAGKGLYDKYKNC